jgi:hypothetical protein
METRKPRSRVMRALVAFYGLASLCLAAAALPIAAVAPLGLDLQGSALDRALAYMLLASPLLLLGGAIAALLAFRRPTRRRLAVMLVPLIAVAGAAALAVGR